MTEENMPDRFTTIMQWASLGAVLIAVLVWGLLGWEIRCFDTALAKTNGGQWTYVREAGPGCNTAIRINNFVAGVIID